MPVGYSLEELHKCTSSDPTRNSSSDLDPLTADDVLTPYIIPTFLDMLISPTARHVLCSVPHLLHAETTVYASKLGVLH